MGVCFPRKFSNLHALRLLLGPKKCWRLATNKILSIKQKLNLGGRGRIQNFRGPLPPYETLVLYMYMYIYISSTTQTSLNPCGPPCNVCIRLELCVIYPLNTYIHVHV